MKGKILLVFSVLGALNVSAQFLQEGQCDPSITLQAEFDASQFTGTWYEIGRSEPPSEGGDCASWNINANGNTFEFSYSSLAKNIPNDAIAQGTLETGTARFTLNYGTGENVDFWILGTSYQNYAVAYSCQNVGATQRSIYIWHLGRETTINPIFDNTMNSLLVPLGITLSELRSVDHSDNACTVLPVIGQNEPIVLPGQCDELISLLNDFDASRFIGTWHQIYSYYSENSRGVCTRADYTLGDGVVNVANSEVIGQALDIIIGTATVVDASTAKLQVMLQVAPGVIAEQDLWIIDTDYENYAISYSCQNINDETKRVFSWIVSRERQLSTQAREAVDQAVDSILDLNFAYFQETDQSDEACAFTPGQFVGECDMTIPAAANFDPEAYMGLWHDIESYSTGFQDGTCNNAFYTLIDGAVDVFNTQVIDQRLDTIRGVAVPVSTDGSAKLEVTFPIVGTDLFITTNYWVLATDYTSYSLVYTCDYNSQTNTKTVFSWKLSRTKTLSNEAIEVINNIISGIPVLDDRFYVIRDQSPEACFYFPDPQPGVPVIFPGECDDSISATPDFIFNQFSGEWYEIETYPKPQSGECVLHEYTEGINNNLNIFSSFLVNGFAASSTSVLQLNSTDNSGKFMITINDGNQELEIPFWVLSTNYNDYAFVYSCMELEDERRAIYSWKLSRNRQQLSETAQTAIANVIQSIDVLDERYFETVEQDEEECVPLPEIPLGQPIILDGQCNPDIPVIQNFSAGDYLGTWHLIESYWSEFQNGACNDATYSLQADGSVLVLNSQVVNQALDTDTLVATIEVTDGSGKLSVVFENAPVPADYWIIDTDYTSYSLVYSCANLDNNRQQIWSWKLSRTKSLTPEAIESIDNSISNIRVLNSAYYYTVDNSDEACFYFPEPDGNPVFFRGQCDETIPVVTNFDAVGYMGLWNDIESYPQLFQEGSCATAEYELRDGGVDVFNTQVVNQTLDVITGRAILVETDDTQAKLEVTFPIAGVGDVVSPYWVLATDYTDFALVYACQNLGPDRRSVSSWKLSRQRSLSTQAQERINEVIASIDVLQQQYYEVKGHTDEDCFYYPEPDGRPVVFRGQCDNSITAFSNIDLERFSGVWNEIETYPKDQVGGQCIHHEFVVSDTSSTTLQLTSNQVFDSDILVSNEGQIVLDSNDGSARFTLSINTESGEIVIPYWVLDTDYDNYALIYSCMNRDTESRAVYSWKLSRFTELSDDSNVAINAALQPIDVLQQEYFEEISHSDDACFYLPDIGLNESVILPGQCDESIPVAQNFLAGEYVGVWHLIETYYSTFQNGDCAEANYIAQEDGSVLVVNSEVVDQTLDTMIGVATLATTDGSAKLSVIFPDAPVPIECWVLDTDYTSFSLVYSCVNLPDNRQQVLSWKLSRSKSLSEDAINRIEEKISETRVLSNRYYSAVDNSDEACFYFPEPDGNPVFFRGQCDETIPVVTNFDAVGYMGLWYDIESYPQFFQEGSCSTAEYELRDGGVDVFNTQVVNQTLDVITGRAILVETDDTQAKLEVIFPIAGVGDVVSPYWVLATDYTDFALVYACQNLGPDTRSVSSWKLSRQRILSTQAQERINEVIAGIDVLQQQYYEVQGHTDDACFYYPEPSGEPVVFRGQCDNNIAAFPDIDLERFSGIWNEIETYPKDQVGGQCISHDFNFTGSANTLLLTSNQVFNSETLVSNNGQIVLDSTDGSGRFSLTIETVNGEITIPYWVLDTDYLNYAVIYSCMNRDDETRAVYSWKLSRTRQLSSESNIAIDAAMESVDVLEQRYFEVVSQTDQSCFYLPETEPNEPAIFPGQCESINVMNNFDADRFTGRWFDIESYYDDYEGTCVDGNFARTTDGFGVVFTHVANQTLESTTSTATLAADGSGRLIVNTNGLIFEYWILDTDYTNWALIYSCDNQGSEQRRVRSWKMSRSRQLSDESNIAIDAIINTVNVLNERYFNLRDHSEQACFYYPEPNGQPVTFRGRCDNSIEVVQDFRVEDYLNTWYDIQSYPQFFQDGECATAQYSVGDGVVNVFNTQVVNQQLDTINGFAVVASEDGSAKLDVTFVVDGITVVTPYWVLATDYNSYSLVYSCTEIDDEYKQVAAWKLSRTRTLSDEAELVIDQVMSGIQVLDQRYFRTIGHSDEDCFYYPDNNGGPVILDGECPSPDDVNVVTDFNIDLFSGTWREFYRFPSERQDGECSFTEYLVQSSSQVSIVDNIVNDERLISINNTGSVSADGRGIISIGDSQIFVLDTDYNEFALIYECQQLEDSSKQIYSWILSRNRDDLSQETTERINARVAEEDDLFELYYERTSQTFDDCFYYPEYEELPAFIELPVPCNTNIQGIANLDAARYLGRWFEIARYPQQDQFGECAQAIYSLSNNGVVDVYNTQVLNQSLLVQEGTAFVSSEDGTGVLEVNFLVNGQTFIANYYILDTDYDNYALVYSCRDLDNDNSQVFSWQLSRDRSLSNEANQAIDAVIASTRGLRDDYYIETSQSDAACFYVPEDNPDEPVIFRGQCQDITGMQNFDVQRYLGVWHEVERYPTGNDDGECVSSNFQSSTVVVDTRVFGESGDISTTTITVTTDGRITRVGQGDVWVVDTDYETYAVLLSCEDYNEEYRRVWSAIHSRSRNLPESAENALSQVLENHDLLYQQFYLSVDQSDDACFYYPAATGAPVILPGQCDESIPVMTDFSIAEYTGTWYQIERYPQFHETGNCTGARYSLNEETGVVTVLNWEVIDGELDTIEGTATAIPSDDGGARFEVTLPSRVEEGEEVVTSLYVLTTDYLTYSLAYSCQNVDPYSRQLGVWKLSRTRDLPSDSEGMAAIEEYMAQRPELDQRYFISVEQSEDCEEPSSSFLINSSLILLLVCSILQLVL